MAKKVKEVNKAQEIRNELAKDPSARGTDIVATLAKRGIEVSPAQVSNIRNAAGAKNAAGGKAKKLAGAPGLKTVVDAAMTMLEHVSVEDATFLLETLGNKRKAK